MVLIHTDREGDMCADSFGLTLVIYFFEGLLKAALECGGGVTSGQESECSASRGMGKKYMQGVSGI